MAHLGLVPSGRSTGETVRRGGITKAGNGRIRHLLVESAWKAQTRLTARYRGRQEGDGRLHRSRA